MAKNKIYRLSDETIGHLVKLLQLGILSGTDVADNFRMLELVADGETLNPSPDYVKTLEDNIRKMEIQAEQMQKTPAAFRGFN